MKYLRVELYGPYGLGGRGKSRIHYIGSRADHLEIIGDGRNGVTVAHPHLRLLLKMLEEQVRSIHRLEVCPTVLPAVGLLHLTAKGMRDKLCAIADAQHGNLPDELVQIHLEGLRIMH